MFQPSASLENLKKRAQLLNQLRAFFLRVMLWKWMFPR